MTDFFTSNKANKVSLFGLSTPNYLYIDSGLSFISSSNLILKFFDAILFTFFHTFIFKYINTQVIIEKSYKNYKYS